MNGKIHHKKFNAMKTDKGVTVNAVIKSGLFSLLLSILLYGCSSQRDQSAEEIIQASLNAVGTKPDRDKIQNLVSFAECVSPDGKYTTEIHTASDGYTYFKQVYSYNPELFEAVIENKIRGFSISDSVKPLSKEVVYTIRGHAFQNIVLEQDKWFHDFERPVKTERDGLKMYEVKAKDELNHPCLIFFDHDSMLLTALHIQNPGDVHEVLKIKFSNWKKIQGILMPCKVTIDQSGKVYSFNFTKLRFNSPDFKYKSVNK